MLGLEYTTRAEEPLMLLKIDWEAVGAIASIITLLAYLYAEREKFATPTQLVINGFTGAIFTGLPVAWIALVILIFIGSVIVGDEPPTVLSVSLFGSLLAFLLAGVPGGIGGMVGLERAAKVGAAFTFLAVVSFWIWLAIVDQELTVKYMFFRVMLTAGLTYLGGLSARKGARVVARRRSARDGF